MQRVCTSSCECAGNCSNCLLCVCSGSWSSDRFILATAIQGLNCSLRTWIWSFHPQAAALGESVRALTTPSLCQTWECCAPVKFIAFINHWKDWEAYLTVHYNYVHKLKDRASPGNPGCPRLCRPGWLRTNRDPPASEPCQCWELKVCTTTAQGLFLYSLKLTCCVKCFNIMTYFSM